MSEFKITVELSDKAYEVLSKLTSSLDNLLANQLLQEGNFQEFAEAKPKKKVVPKKTEVVEEKPAEPKTEAVDFEKLRAEIRMLASSKKVAGKDVKAVLKAFGGKLSEVSDDKLEALRDEMAAL
ncbi:MAG: hypothetical protein HXL65_01360 [Streptococcus sp.]|nr:hypothetical protein [Streptococcus sp.]